MRLRQLLPATLAVAITGCGEPLQAPRPSALGGSVQATPGDAPLAGFRLKQAPDAPVGVLGASASSTRDGRWFAPQHVVDGNLRSAWGPAAGDAGPTLTLHLGRAVDLSAIAVKLSGATAGFGVEAWVAGAWVPLQSDVRTAEAVLDTVPLPKSRTNRIRLRFAGADAASLLVCEVKAIGSLPPPPQESPFDCFALPGTQSVEVLADTASRDLIAFMTITDLVRTPTSVGGTVVVDPEGQSSPFSGPVTGATFDGTLMTLSGPLTTGGSYSADLLFIRQDSPTTMVVAPVHYFALLPSFHAAYTFEDPTPGASAVEWFTLNLICIEGAESEADLRRRSLEAGGYESATSP